MGWLDKATAAARIAASEARKATLDGMSKVESDYSGDARYESLKDRLRVLADKAKVAAAEVSAFGSEIAQEASATEWGTKIGDNARATGAFLSTLPVLTAMGDSVQSRNGVDELYAQFLESPKDPLRAVLLAEALLRCEKDLKVYQRVRSVTSLTYALRRKMITSTLELGAEDHDPTRLRLLKIAFSQSDKRVRRNPADAVALHVLARVYSGMGHHADAVTAAKLAVLADPSDGLPWVTLGRAYLGLGQAANAERASLQAVQLGAGYGNEIAASALLFLEENPGLATISRFEELRSQITTQDRVDYLGFASDVWGVAETLTRKQTDRFNTHANKLTAL